MKQLLDLDSFAKILTDKGYDGYFLTQAGYPGKVKESIRSFLKDCDNGKEKPLSPNLLHINTYLEWNGEDKQKVSCDMWVKYQDGKFDVQNMTIEKTDRYGHSIKKSELTNLTTGSIPTVKEVLTQVSEKPKEHLSPRKKGFRM